MEAPFSSSWACITVFRSFCGYPRPAKYSDALRHRGLLVSSSPNVANHQSLKQQCSQNWALVCQGSKNIVMYLINIILSSIYVSPLKLTHITNIFTPRGVAIESCVIWYLFQLQKFARVQSNQIWKEFSCLYQSVSRNVQSCQGRP